MTDTEITEKLAEFMGWKFHDTGDQYIRDGHIVFRVDINEDKYKFWNPLENISNAWELVEKLNYLNVSINRENCSGIRYDVTVYNDYNFDDRIHITAETAPRAICMAVLKVMENGDER